jgi:hypothetical protein
MVIGSDDRTKDIGVGGRGKYERMWWQGDLQGKKNKKIDTSSHHFILTCLFVKKITN